MITFNLERFCYIFQEFMYSLRLVLYLSCVLGCPAVAWIFLDKLCILFEYTRLPVKLKHQNYFEVFKVFQYSVPNACNF